MCVDYQALYSVTIKNLYPLPHISAILDRIKSTTILTRLNLCSAYNLIRIKEGDEYKTAFRMYYGRFEYRVMPFGLTNAPATFQAYIDECLRSYRNDFVVCYLDDILIYSRTPKEHKEHVK